MIGPKATALLAHRDHIARCYGYHQFFGTWVKLRKLFARKRQAEMFKVGNIPSSAKWEFMPVGQHIELGIAEMNLLLLLAAAGLSHSIFCKRVIPIGTVYDPFVSRGLDALNYACYQDARFVIVGTPSGVTLAPEGGVHQSIASTLIGMSQGGLAGFEPAFGDELAVMVWRGSRASNHPHGIEHFGQTGTITDLYRHFRIDAAALARSTSEMTRGRKIVS